MAGPDLTGRKLVFDEEFNGTAVDWTKWAGHSNSQGDCERGNKSNEQLGYALDANAAVAGGFLTITAKKLNFTSPCSGTVYNWTNARLQSSPSFAFQYGYIEERAKFPPEKGFRVAFWTWQPPGYPGPGTQEVDPYEYYSDNKTKLHLGGGPGIPSDAGSFVYTLPFDPTTDFHTYGADVQPTKTDFYVDGKLIFTSKPRDNTTKANIITDMAVYSTVPPDASTTNATKTVDYIRAWSKDPNLPAVQPQPGYDGPPPCPGCAPQ